MKTTLLLTALGAIAIAIFAIWNTNAIKKQADSEIARLSDRVRQQDDQIQAIGEFQELFAEIVNVDNRSPNKQDSSQNDNKQQTVEIDNRLKNQGKANDNQWQDIDFLKSQRIFHKQLIDQINSDLVRIKRDLRETNKSLKLRNDTNTVSSSDFVAVQRRVDELYRRISRGGR